MAPESSPIDRETDALYALRPGEFVAARDALARRLRAEGHRAEANAVRALVRPTVAAWAVNQLARREPEWTAALATAGRRLEAAHGALVERGDRDGWHEATAAQREAIDRLAKLAEGLVREERGSVSAPVRDTIRSTLHAATVDPGVREAVSVGRLSREQRATGLLGADPTATRAQRVERPANVLRPPRGARSGATPPPATSAAGSASAAEREARAARRAAERETRALLRRAEREATAARAAADRAGKAAERARKAHGAATAALDEAHAAAAARADELDRAQRQDHEATAALAEREAAVAAAHVALERVLRPA